MVAVWRWVWRWQWGRVDGSVKGNSGTLEGIDCPLLTLRLPHPTPANTTCLVASAAELAKNSSRVREARESVVPVVGEELIHEAVEAKQRPDPYAFLIRMGTDAGGAGAGTSAGSGSGSGSGSSKSGARKSQGTAKVLVKGGAVVDEASGLDPRSHKVRAAGG